MAKDQRSIAEVIKLDTRLPRDQDIANSLAKGFGRKHFQRLLLEWVIEENHTFSVCEQGKLRQIFEYLRPLVRITDANITRTTVRRKVLSAYEAHKDKVVAVLKRSCGLIHASFDGWRSKVIYACDRNNAPLNASTARQRRTCSRRTGRKPPVWAKESLDGNLRVLSHRPGKEFSQQNHLPSPDVSAHPANRQLNEKDAAVVSNLTIAGATPRDIRTYLHGNLGTLCYTAGHL
jgi:hypothetical protein